MSTPAAPARKQVSAFAPDVHVIGGGLAGCEAAWQLARRGARVALIEMKPARLSPAHRTPLLAELVCSNSLRSDDPGTAPGLLKAELRQAGSLVIACADAHRVPAGDALAVDRVGFAREVTLRLALEPRVRIERRVLDDLPAGPVVVATGPLTAGGLARRVRDALGGARLYFYDAIAPIVDAETIDWTRAFRQSRLRRFAVDRPARGAAGSGGAPAESSPGGDYVNCPLDRDEYRALVRALGAARQVMPRTFEEPRYFEGCLPVEVMVERGEDVLAFGPMRPVGLIDPTTGRRPYAVLQLRAENRHGTAYNLVGFQTRLAHPEQRRVFRMIPALRQAEFLRYGGIHRNSYIDSPRLLGRGLELRDRPEVRFAGQMTGVEGYIESCATGLLAGLFAWGALSGCAVAPPPPTTALGGLHTHLTASRAPDQRFEPTNVHFGLLPPAPADPHMHKRDRRAWLRERARGEMGAWLATMAASG